MIPGNAFLFAGGICRFLIMVVIVINRLRRDQGLNYINFLHAGNGRYITGRMRKENILIYHRMAAVK